MPRAPIPRQPSKAGRHEKAKVTRVAAKPLKTTAGPTQAVKTTILVDAYTKGIPEILAKALASKGMATVEGKSGGDPSAIELRKLPDGSGYTLVTGVYSSKAPAAEVRK